MRCSAVGRPHREFGAAGAATGNARKRKWQEELSEEEGGGEEKITKADIEAWRKTIAEEEKEEQMEREKQAKEELERERQRKLKEEAAQRKREREEAQALREAEEARKHAEDAENERRRQEDQTLAPPGPLPPDRPGALPPGMRAEKMHLYKTTYCKRWEQGQCQFGAACHFAHGERDLRGRPPKGSPPGTMSTPLPEDVPRARIVPPPVQLPMPPIPPLHIQALASFQHFMQ